MAFFAPFTGGFALDSLESGNGKTERTGKRYELIVVSFDHVSMVDIKKHRWIADD